MSDIALFRPASTPSGAVMLPSDDGEWVRLSSAYALARPTISKLEARLAEAERDAQRYRWLRERINWRDVDESGGAFSRDPLKYQARHWTHSDVRLPSSRPASEHIDEYIDAQLTAVSADGATP